ncbi:hypothetical protein QBC47DRAFT_408655 [Echria macrotheca]|uniref:Uncharacterized protein n=1 Tax=Echria macrotheca TaxID=438768 RepID=A0AAJ0BRA6_9PEZI|nr:hypothetical protein QBC47DRAFT_408655 [Echria macrotheca]
MPESKDEKIARAQANLPLPEQPPVPSDWQSADARNLNVGTGAVESDISYGDASSAGLREPATQSSEQIDMSRFGRQGHDNLDAPPKDALTKEAKKALK